VIDRSLVIAAGRGLHAGLLAKTSGIAGVIADALRTHPGSVSPSGSS